MLVALPVSSPLTRCRNCISASDVRNSIDLRLLYGKLRETEVGNTAMRKAIDEMEKSMNASFRSTNMHLDNGLASIRENHGASLTALYNELAMIRRDMRLQEGFKTDSNTGTQAPLPPISVFLRRQPPQTSHLPRSYNRTTPIPVDQRIKEGIECLRRSNMIARESHQSSLIRADARARETPSL